MELSAIFQPKEILAPYDYSEPSNLALKYACVGARIYGARLTVLHAHSLDLPPYFTEGDQERLLAEIEAAKRNARDHLARRVGRILDLAQCGPQVSFEVADTHPVDAILEAAERHRAELIVLGTHGRGGAKRLLLGSVTENVVRQSPAPVFVVRQKQHEIIDPADPSKMPTIRNVLCPVNEMAVSRRAVGHAAAVAARFGAALTLLHVVEDGAASEESSRERFGPWIEECKSADVCATLKIRHGKAADGIIDYARETNQDLIVTGARLRDAGGPLFGSTTETLLRRAPAPVFVVPGGTERPEAVPPAG